MRNRKRQQDKNKCDKMIWNWIRDRAGVRYRKSMMHKICMIALILIMMIIFCGCSLAIEDAGGEAQINTDHLVGAFVTTESLYLFDMEAYVNDHADELLSGTASGNISDEEMIDTMKYNGRIYATVDKHDSTNPGDWEISFGDVEGICFFDSKWEREGVETFTMLTCGDEICDVNNHLHVTDEGESVTLTGTMYALVEAGATEVKFFLNPVYQTESGEIYVVEGMGHSLTGDIGGSFSLKLEDEKTVTEDGESQTYSGAVELTVEILKTEPTKIRMHFMDENLEILHTEEYAAGEVPAQLEAVENATCIVVETVWADGAVTRELFEPEESETLYVETFYKTSDVALGKQGTEIIWK